MSPQRQQKQQQLLGRLQDLLLGPKADEQTTCEVLDYFLRRLGSSQVASRVLAMKVSAAARCPVRATPPRLSSQPVAMPARSPAWCSQEGCAGDTPDPPLPSPRVPPGQLGPWRACLWLLNTCLRCSLHWGSSNRTQSIRGSLRAPWASGACSSPPAPPGCPAEVWWRPADPVCLQGLSLVLSEGSLRDRDGEEKEPPAEEDSGDAETLQGYQWLLRDLPRLPLFHSVSATTALALQQAVHMETDPQTVSAYLVYLSQHTPVEEQGSHSDLALVRGSGSRRDLRSELAAGAGELGHLLPDEPLWPQAWLSCCSGPCWLLWVLLGGPVSVRGPAFPGAGGSSGTQWAAVSEPAMRASRRARSPAGRSLCRGPAHGARPPLWVLRVTHSCRPWDGVRGPSPRWVGGSCQGCVPSRACRGPALLPALLALLVSERPCAQHPSPAVGARLSVVWCPGQPWCPALGCWLRERSP